MTENNQENQIRMGFFKRVLVSIKDFEKYIDFAVEKTSTAISYLIKLILIFTIVISAVFTYNFFADVQNGIKYFKDEMPDLSYENGELIVKSEEEIKIENDKSILQYIMIDTNATDEEKSIYITEVSGYNTGLIILNDKMVMKNAMLREPIEYKYTDIATQYGISSFNKEQVVQIIDSADQSVLYFGFFTTMFIYMFLVYFTTALLDVVTIFLLGLIISRMVGIKIKCKPIFNMSIYSLTLSILLNMIYIVVNAFTGFTIQYFQWMYTAIASIYMIVAILMIKADFINKQKELMRIVEEQEKVRQEMQEREEREKEKKEKEKKERGEEDKKEEKKKNKEDNNIGEEPKGSEA